VETPGTPADQLRPTAQTIATCSTMSIKSRRGASGFSPLVVMIRMCRRTRIRTVVSDAAVPVGENDSGHVGFGPGRWPGEAARPQLMSIIFAANVLIS
jgi:hypothetical protein